jgi:hypothetical protein
VAAGGAAPLPCLLLVPDFAASLVLAVFPCLFALMMEPEMVDDDGVYVVVWSAAGREHRMEFNYAGIVDLHAEAVSVIAGAGVPEVMRIPAFLDMLNGVDDPEVADSARGLATAYAAALGVECARIEGRSPEDVLSVSVDVRLPIAQRLKVTYR